MLFEVTTLKVVPLKAVKKLLGYYSTVLLIFVMMVTCDCCINVKLLTENPAASLAFLRKLAKQNHHNLSVRRVASNQYYVAQIGQKINDPDTKCLHKPNLPSHEDASARMYLDLRGRQQSYVNIEHIVLPISSGFKRIYFTVSFCTGEILAELSKL